MPVRNRTRLRVQRPLAIVVIGGLVSSTAFDLLLAFVKALVQGSGKVQHYDYGEHLLADSEHIAECHRN